MTTEEVMVKCRELRNVYTRLEHPIMHCATVRSLSNGLNCSPQTLSSIINHGTYQGWIEIRAHWQGLSGDGPGVDNDPRYEVLTLRFNV